MRPNRILDPPLALYVPDDRETLPIGRPVGAEHVVGELARGSAAGRYNRQRAGPVVRIAALDFRQQYGEFPRARDREKIRAWHANPQLTRLRPYLKQAAVIAIPGGAEEERLTVGGKPGIGEVTGLEREALERHISSRRCRSTAA